MGRETRKTALPAVGKSAKARHQTQGHRIAQADPAVYSTLNALKQAPKLKHKSHFEIFDNADKKAKKLETQVTSDRVPPPGYEFVALGNPDLTALCKDLSREQDAMIFIVSESKDQSVHSQTHRLGWHFRERIVDQARQELLASGRNKPQKIAVSGRPEAIPSDRYQIMKEADAVLRDLFPRIPNISRMEILSHSFDKDNKFFNGKEKVGMAEDLSLARRVQLAALSHIRHTMTRYDALLREGQKWENARKAVEKPCLDIIVKWRGDEETGRDQLDEILREVIEISDNEDSEEDATSEEEPVPGPSKVRARASIPAVDHIGAAIPRQELAFAQTSRREPSIICLTSPKQPRKPTRKERKAAKQTQQRFKRYAQVAKGFRHESHAPGSPVPDHLSRNLALEPSVAIAGHPESPLHGERIVVSSYQPRTPYTGPTNGASRQRGQSPVFVRVAEGNGSKVGSAFKSPGYYSTPISPVRNVYQDMLVRSIEPQSPGAQRSHDRAPSYSFAPGSERDVGSRRIISRAAVEQPVSSVRPGSPSYDSARHIAPSTRQHMITRPSEHSDLFSGAGFIQVHRGPQHRVVTQEYPTNRARSNLIPVTRDPYVRVRSPAVYVQEPAATDHDDVLYRPRVDPIHAGEPRLYGRDEVSLRSRDHPILLDTPFTSRIVDTRDHMNTVDPDPRSHRRPEVFREVPPPDIRRVSDRPQVVYVDRPDTRYVRLGDQQTQQGSQQFVPASSGLDGPSFMPSSYRNDSLQVSREIARPTKHQPVSHLEADGYVPVPAGHLPRAVPHKSHHEALYHDHQQPQHATVRESGRDYAPVQQHHYLDSGNPSGSGSYY